MDTESDWDTCIIGAGAAGLALASSLADSGVRITLLEAASGSSPELDPDMFRVDLTALPHLGVHTGRFQALGGSTTRWGGQLWPWEPGEFSERSHVPFSGWPISYDELSPYYERALRLLRVTPRFDAQRAAAAGIVLPAFDSDRLTVKYSKWMRWRDRNLGSLLGRRLLTLPSVEVCQNAVAVELVTDEAGESIRGVRVRTADGRTAIRRANTVILACGTIESVRLLMASKQSHPAGIGNGSDWLGRAFMDHLSVRTGEVTPRSRRSFNESFAPFYDHGILHTMRMVVNPVLAAREHLLASYAHLETDLPETSGVGLIRNVLRAAQERRSVKIGPRELRQLASGTAELLRLTAGMVFRGRRHFPTEAKIHLRVDTEQAPNRESRITLSDERDEHGMPRVSLAWKLSDHERRTVQRTTMLVAQELARLDLAELTLDEPSFDDPSNWGDRVRDSFHMMGGARMSRTPVDGVVDTNCQVHGVRNLYVASGAVFPTGGMANPTLTIIALALRLADHLVTRRAHV